LVALSPEVASTDVVSATVAVDGTGIAV